MENTLPITVTATESAHFRELYSLDYLLLLPLQGSVLIKGVEETAAETGTLIFMAPFSDRRVYLNPGSSILSAAISANFLESMIGIPKSAPLLILKDNFFQATEQLVNYFDLCCNNSSATYLQKMGACFDLLRALERDISVASHDAGQGRKYQLASYLEKNFREPLQLENLAREFGVTRQHMSTMFHKELGQSFSSYLLRMRLGEAQRLLLTTDKNITTIAEESGFPNLRAFNVSFRKQQGCSPKEYRQQNLSFRRTSDAVMDKESLRSVNQLLQPYRMVYSRSEEAISLSHEIKAGGGILHGPLWNDTLNIDNSADLLQSMVQESVAAIQNELHFRYIRLTNILCHALTPFIAATGAHRYTLFSRVIDFVKELDLIPTLSFGNAYTILLDSVMPDDGQYSVALQDWLNQLSSMLDAAISNWGKEWVSLWRFEFHMPESLYGETAGNQFMELFDKSLRLIKERLPEAQVGGPSMALDEDHRKRWECWFRGIRERGIPVDFVSAECWAEYSIHSTGFPGQYGEWVGVKTVGQLINTDVSFALEKVRQLRTHLESDNLKVKLYISALGITKYQAMAAQIGGHCAAYLIKCIIELQDLVDGIGCWKAVNNEAEYPSENSIFGNGCGLLSRYDLKNPSWYAYSFLSQLLPRHLFQSSNALITTDGNGAFSVLVHNCKNYSEYFHKHYLDFKGYNFQDTQMYTSNAALKQTLTFTGLAPQTYLIRQYLIGDHHGNIATVLKQMGYMRHLSRSEISYVAGQSLPFQHTYQIHAVENLNLSVTLQPNEVMLLLVTPDSVD